MTSTCGNPSCDKPGKSTCVACGLVSYCGPDCQKAHWSDHKGICKANRKKSINAGAPSPSPATKPLTSPQPYQQPTVQVEPALATKLQSVKRETQLAFQSGDFEGSIKYGQEALEVTKSLPEPAQSIEAIQISLNLTTAYLQLGKFDDAETQSQVSVDIAEKATISRNVHPQAVDMLSATLTTRAFVLLNLNRLDEGEKCSRRALKLNEKLFTTNDPRMYKVYRSLGLILARKDEMIESEKYLRLAYEVASITSGPCNGDAQMSADELLQILIKKKDSDDAEKFIRSNYQAMKDTTTDDNSVYIGEGAAKYASVLIGQGKAIQAEKYLKESLSIREKVFGPNSQQVAMTLMGLANLREALNDVSETTESLLVRALNIFKNLSVEEQQDSQISTHIMNCVSFTQRIRLKRSGGGGGGNTTSGNKDVIVEDVDDEDDDTQLVSTSTTAKSTSGSKSSSSTASTTTTNTNESKLKALKNRDRINEKYISPTKDLDPADGITRMKLAAKYFEETNFGYAEICLQEAYEIFMIQFGPTHPSTLTAKQNLDIVKHNGLNILWQEIVLEEKQKLIEKSMNNMSLHGNNGEFDPVMMLIQQEKNNSNTSTTNGIHTVNKGIKYDTNSSEGQDDSDWKEINADIWKVDPTTANSSSSSCIVS